MKLKKADILQLASIGCTIASDIFFVRNSKKLYKKTREPTKKEYLKAYALPIGLSATSIVTSILSNKEHRKENALLLATNAALLTGAAKNEQNTKTVLEKNLGKEETKKVQNEIDNLNLQDIVDEVSFLDKEDIDSNPNRALYLFTDLKLFVYTTPDAITMALANSNQHFVWECSTSVSEILYEIEALDLNATCADAVEDIRSIEDFTPIDIFLKNHPFYSKSGYNYGWVMYDEDCESGLMNVDFIEKERNTNGGIVRVIKFIFPPMMFDSWQDWYEQKFKEFEMEIGKYGNSSNYQEKI